MGRRKGSLYLKKPGFSIWSLIDQSEVVIRALGEVIDLCYGIDFLITRGEYSTLKCKELLKKRSITIDKFQGQLDKLIQINRAECDALLKKKASK